MVLNISVVAMHNVMMKIMYIMCWIYNISTVALKECGVNKYDLAIWTYYLTIAT